MAQSGVLAGLRVRLIYGLFRTKKMADLRAPGPPQSTALAFHPLRVRAQPGWAADLKSRMRESRTSGSVGAPGG